MSDITKKSPYISFPETKKEMEIYEQMARQFLAESTTLPIDPHILLQNLGLVIKKFHDAEDKGDVGKELLEKLNEAISIVSLDSHYGLAKATIEDLRPFAIEFSRQLVAEYDCITPTEKALVETIAAAYIRILEFTGYMTRMTRDERCSMILSGAYKVASQELDRANRHFINAVSTLKQLKSPTMNIQVKATNAFVAQNQQVNTASLEPSVGNEKVYETVDPK